MIKGTKAEVTDLQRIDDVEAGLPRNGVRVGGGKRRAHPLGYGDTKHLRGLRKHPDRDEWAYELGPEPDPKHVSQADKQKYKEAKAKDAPLDATWEPKPIGAKP